MRESRGDWGEASTIYRPTSAQDLDRADSNTAPTRTAGRVRRVVSL